MCENWSYVTHWKVGRLARFCPITNQLTIPWHQVMKLLYEALFVSESIFCVTCEMRCVFVRLRDSLTLAENVETDRLLQECALDPTVFDKKSIIARSYQNKKRVSESSAFLSVFTVASYTSLLFVIWAHTEYFLGGGGKASSPSFFTFILLYHFPFLLFIWSSFLFTVAVSPFPPRNWNQSIRFWWRYDNLFSYIAQFLTCNGFSTRDSNNLAVFARRRHYSARGIKQI